MFEILTIFIVYLISLNLAAFLGVAFLTVFLQFKKRGQKSGQENLIRYLDKIGTKGWFLRLNISYMCALGLLAVANYYSFFDHSIAYTITLLIAGIFHLSFKYQKRIKRL
ncbi:MULTISPECIES: hypothetical protein [unclassified Enterococcus]|uniref:hypothetical protein n=1 Tax=unclassified Enterococcus TaxID=2608891 RepID=UPI0013EDD5CE|nr:MULTISPECIES: hypothetical protein [unclassified Enterococcus]